MASPANSLPSVSPRSLFLIFGTVLQHWFSCGCGFTQGVAQDFCRCFCNVFSREKIVQNASRNPPGGSPERPRSLPEQSQNLSRQTLRATSNKIMPKVLRVFVKFALFGSFWDPAEAPKSTKNGPRAEKVRPETAPEPFFCVFSRRCRSESV